MTEEDRLNEYVKAIPCLTIFESTEGLQNRVNELEFERSHEISILLQKDSMNTDAISALSDKLQVAMAEIEKLKNRK
jgi:hypothetical protein